MSTRAYVTGIGAVTPFGVGVDRLWDGLISGRSAVREIQQFDPSGLAVRIAGEVPDFQPGDHMEVKAARRMARYAQFAVAAARQAIAHAGLVFDRIDRDRAAVVLNTGAGGIPSLEGSVLNLARRGRRAVSPLAIPLYIQNMAASHVSIAFGITGPSLAGVGACAAGIMAINDAVRLIEDDLADVVIAGASEALLSPIMMAGFAATGALSERNDDPTGACRPFSSDRTGTVLAEGCCVMIIESEAHAVRRGATAMAIAAGGATTSDGYHITAPDPDGVQAGRAILRTIVRAGLAPADVDFFSAHGTGSRLGDLAETKAVQRAFGPNFKTVAVSSTKSTAGHLVGAAGALSATACVLAIGAQLLPPTINLVNPDPQCDLNHVPNEARRAEVRAAMANGLAFGGQNASTLFRRVD